MHTSLGTGDRAERHFDLPFVRREHTFDFPDCHLVKGADMTPVRVAPVECFRVASAADWQGSIRNALPTDNTAESDAPDFTAIDLNQQRLICRRGPGRSNRCRERGTASRARGQRTLCKGCDRRWAANEALSAALLVLEASRILD